MISFFSFLNKAFTCVICISFYLSNIMFVPVGDSKCFDIGGKCKDTANKCYGKFEDNLCQGPPTRKCCNEFVDSPPDLPDEVSVLRQILCSVLTRIFSLLVFV